MKESSLMIGPFDIHSMFSIKAAAKGAEAGFGACDVGDFCTL